jgi:Galactosyltransferase
MLQFNIKVSLLLLFSMLVIRCITYNYFNLTTLSTMNCKNEKMYIPNPNKFLLGIFCTYNDSAKMNLIRDTMLGSQLPETTRNAVCALQDYLLAHRPRRCTLIYTFVIGRNYSASTKLEMTGLPFLDTSSHAEFDSADIINLNIKENMNYGKSPSWFYFASTLLENDLNYVGKSDIDTFISIPQLINFIQNDLPISTIEKKNCVYGGVLMDFISCGASENCIPIQRRFYMSGQFYFLSSDIVNELRLWRYEVESKSEDLDIGLRIWKYNHNVNAFVFHAKSFWIHFAKDEISWNDAYQNAIRNNWTISTSFLQNI